MHDAILKSILNGLYFSGVQAVTGFWTGGIGAILMLHHVREDSGSVFRPNAHLQITPEFLDKILRTFKKSDYDFVSLDELHEAFRTNKFDPSRKMIAVTLDDGYRDNLQNAAPIFRKHNVPYTIYVAPGLLDGRADLWWEDLSAIIASQQHIQVAFPKGTQEFDISTLAKKHRLFGELMQWLTTRADEEQQRKFVRELAWLYKIDTAGHCKNQLMDWNELHELATDRLCTIGAHTIHHYALARLSVEDARWEMRESAGIIQSELGERPRHFSYPYGYPLAAGRREFEIAADLAFDTAVTTRHGVLYQAHEKNLHALPRISLNGNFQSVRYVETLLSGLPTLLQNKGRRLNVT